MSDDLKISVILFTMMLGGGVLGFCMGAANEKFNMQDQAIERGYALYCPTTGDFAWKGECDE